MDIILTEQQQEALNKMKEQGFLYLIAGTGWGKSFVSMKAIQEIGTATIIAPAHLVKDWEKKLSEYNIKAIVYSMQWLSRQDYLKFSLERTDLVIIDEFHRTVSYRSKIYKLLKRNPFDNYLFCSATPYEKGVWEMYAPVRVNHKLRLWKTKPEYNSHTSFQNEHLKMGGFENREIKGINPDESKFLESLLFVVELTDDKYLKEISVNIKAVDDVKEFQKENFYSSQAHNPFAINDSSNTKKVAFAKQRTISNGFEYKDGETVSIFGFDDKYKELEKILLKHKKTLIFYEYRAEKEFLESKGVYIYDGYKSVDLFEKTHNCMAVHYRSLGEGIRLKFLDSIVLFTTSTSAKMITQAIGRGKYAGRVDDLTVYRFQINTETEKISKNKTPLNSKIKQKESNIKNIYKK